MKGTGRAGSVAAHLAQPTAPTGLPTGDEKTKAVRTMFDAIAPRYDVVNRMMTFGLDLRWRRQAVRALGLPRKSLVLDLACGTGDFLAILGRVGLRSFGIDLSSGMLRANHIERPLIQADATLLPLASGSVDGVTCGYALRNFTTLGAVFDELGRVVRPGGRISLLEVAEPEHGPLLTGHRVWFHRAVPLIGALVSDADAYRYLPRSTAYLPTTAGLRTMLMGSGFSTVNRRPLSGGLSQLITATRRGLR
ncbi:MAG TPA: ubiquinone/menaquinone biosynthesis methyltransferase [Acidimicrobiales bacterium]|jgi:demethylmenaquinone methyltransferase/2-methoxy-6-polyprenyl-1,4-benzoquinol methylase|nr:ubiquinone/menaquinone biosynthesis methyltransferase [Acidimicrobiales bacterium]